MSQPGLFDIEERLSSLTKAGDPLEGLSQVVDFEISRKSLNKILKYSDRKKGDQAALRSCFDVQNPGPFRHCIVSPMIRQNS